jgi:CMP-N,N'-diacetyllegionaminic acid synthase
MPQALKVLGIIPPAAVLKESHGRIFAFLRASLCCNTPRKPALGAKRLARVILSTEDKEIAEIGRRCGLAVPFMRPAELARDDTPSLPVLQHAVQTLEGTGERYDAICLLQPTNPLRQSSDIDACIQLLDETGADSVVTVLPVPHQYNPHWVYFRDDHGFLRLSTGEDAPVSRRQSLPPAFHREGSVYLELVPTGPHFERRYSE